MFAAWRGAKTRAKSVASRGRRRPRVEGLERRDLLTTLPSPTVWTVNSTADKGKGTGNAGDLLYCITGADADTNTGGDVINFDPTTFKRPKTITVSGGELALTNTTGPQVIGGQTYDVTISGKGTGSVLQVAEGVTASLYNITISGGSSKNTGAGISSDGLLSIVGTTITGNSITTTRTGSALAGGAGIYNGPDGMLTILNSQIVDNSLTNPNNAANPGNGAGISNFGSASIFNSTISGNSASNGFGGGVANYGNLAMINTTIAGNTTSSGGSGGAISNVSGLTTINCTIADNTSTGTSPGVGGIVSSGGQIVLKNTIVASNTAGSGRKAVASDIADPMSSIDLVASGYNLIGTGGSGGLTNATNGNLVGIADPGLGTLANNGGLTQTIALEPTSVALAAGDVAYITPVLFGSPTTDQRGTGYARVVSGQVDIGAYETQPAS